MTNRRWSFSKIWSTSLATKLTYLAEARMALLSSSWIKIRKVMQGSTLLRCYARSTFKIISCKVTTTHRKPRTWWSSSKNATRLGTTKLAKATLKSISGWKESILLCWRIKRSSFHTSSETIVWKYSYSSVGTLWVRAQGQTTSITSYESLPWWTTTTLV